MNGRLMPGRWGLFHHPKISPEEVSMSRTVRILPQGLGDHWDHVLGAFLEEIHHEIASQDKIERIVVTPKGDSAEVEVVVHE